MQIQWTKSAKKNLLHIEEYIGKDNPKAALNTVLAIIKIVEVLTVHPKIGREGRVHGTHELIINGTPYIVAYRIKAKTIEILRILHGAMKWPESI